MMYSVYCFNDFGEEESLTLIKSGFYNYELACSFASELNDNNFNYIDCSEFFAAKDLKSLDGSKDQIELYSSDERTYIEYRLDYSKYKKLLLEYFPDYIFEETT